jgi:hypothetical protein
MAKKRKTRKDGKAAEEPLSPAHKREFREGLEKLEASVKQLHALAVSNTYVGKRPMAARARRRRRG